MVDPKVKTLITLLEVGSYTRTAEELHLTQPAVSHHIRQLEQEYGIKIFGPDKKDLKLTEEGKVLVKYGRRIIGLENRARQIISDRQKQLHRLTIGLTQTAGENLLPQAIALYCSEHPDTSINIFTDSIQKLYERLKLYELDMAVVEGPMAGSSFKSILLDTDYLCLIVSPEHPFAARQSIRLGELKGENLILRSPTAGTRILFENYLLSHSENIESFHVMMEIDNIATIKELVAANLGVSIIARSACREDERNGRLAVVPIENVSMTRDIRIIYPPDFSHPEVLEELRQIYERVQYK